MAEIKEKVLTYRGKPLVRQGRSIYYGDMHDDYVVMIQIATTKKVKDLDVADKVLVQLLKTDPDIPPAEKIVRKSERRGLWAAMDMASIWLDMALKEN